MEATSSILPQRKRRKTLKQDIKQPLLCSVCGADAHGYNFDAITCDSCKVFFRRAATRDDTGEYSQNLVRQCIDGTGQCVITKSSRKRCPPCRMRRCLEVGMKREWITPLNRLVLRSNYNTKTSHKTSSKATSSSSKSRRSSFRRTPYSIDENSPKTSVLNAASEEKVIKMECSVDSTIVERADPPHQLPKPSSRYFKLKSLHFRPVSPGNGVFDSGNDSIDDNTTGFITKLFSAYYEQVERAYTILMEPLTEDDVQRYNLREALPSMEKAFNRREFGVRRLIRAFKDMPQFSMLTRPCQMSIVKETMRGVSSLFFILHADPVSNKMIFEYITLGGELDYVEVTCKSAFIQGLKCMPPQQWPFIFSIFSPSTSDEEALPQFDSKSMQDILDKFHHHSSSWTLDDLFGECNHSMISPEYAADSAANGKLHSTISHVYPPRSMNQGNGGHSPLLNLFLPNTEQMDAQLLDDTACMLTDCIYSTFSKICKITGDDKILLTTACLLRLFRVNENSSQLQLSRNDRYLIQKTRYELNWFFNQYARQIWKKESETSRYEPKGWVMESDTDKSPKCNMFYGYDSNLSPMVPIMTGAAYTPMGEASVSLPSIPSIPSILSTTSSQEKENSLSERLRDLNQLFDMLEKIEKTRLHMEYFIRREQITPLMREFLPDTNLAEIGPTS